MRSKKTYSNATFTKRVDHEAGRHHTARASREPAQCSGCGAVYKRRRWVLPEAVNEEARPAGWRPARLTVCPACKQKHERTPQGFLYASGPFLKGHQEEIVRLLKNEADRAAADNPLGKIMSCETGDTGLNVTTTTEHLVERLGQALEKAFGGKVRYDFSHENKLARVYWKRD